MFIRQSTYYIFTLLLLFSDAFAGQDSIGIYYERAYIELKDMLEGKQQPDFERAVFVSENPFRENQYAYADFQAAINVSQIFIEILSATNDKSDSIDFSVKVNANGRFNVADIRYTEKKKKELYQKTLKNWAIFTYITDTTAIFPFYHLPFSYSTNDPFGMKDWSNSQVMNLFFSDEKQGNCFALTGFYKIIADRLQTGARICTAPQHIYIQHQDHKGDYYNVELATAGHPGDGKIQTLTYTTNEAIMSGIALRSYTDKESIGLCLVNLAKGYEHKFDTKDDAFILKCAELALQYDSLNLNALLLKQQVLDARVTTYALQNKINDLNRIKADKDISGTLSLLQKHLAKLHELGYRQMPLDMEQMVLNGFREENTATLLMNKNPKPFTSIQPNDPNDERYWTVSQGAFQEVFEPKKIETYEHFIFDSETKMIAAIDTSTRNNFLIDPVAFAYDFGARGYDSRLGIFTSVDPLAKKFPGFSPYVGMANNPIFYIDLDGREPIKPLVGTSATFRTLLDNSPSKVGLYTGDKASNYLKNLGNTKFSWEQMRPLPTETGFFNKKEGRYIYTEKGGWVDMAHFMFYAGKAYQYKLDGKENPIGDAVQDGYKQEMSDKYAAKHSAYSYEDLPSDKFGAEFGAKHFDPTSKQTFGEQIESYLNNVLKATDPKHAPNFESLPTKEPDKPTRTNTTTKPVYTKDKK